ncbi:MAG: hypothetical protein KKD05_08430 [Candidatus Omnitrophica bacterium]|nr:hypothetical protein [Candidatus Omnitrophota bacterium]
MEKILKGVLAGIVLSFVLSGMCFAQKAFEEVNKGEIPGQFLDTTLKTHPLGFLIWDEKEVIDTFDSKKKNILWVDTRLLHLYKEGTVKGSVLLTYDKNETLPEAELSETKVLTKASLLEEIAKIDPVLENVTVVFFCQGPKCHRSYNAALRAVQNWGFKPEQIIWFRAGFPLLFKYLKESPKLERKMNRYVQGDLVGM